MSSEATTEDGKARSKARRHERASPAKIRTLKRGSMPPMRWARATLYLPPLDHHARQYGRASIGLHARRDRDDLLRGLLEPGVFREPQEERTMTASALMPAGACTYATAIIQRAFKARPASAPLTLAMALAYRGPVQIYLSFGQNRAHQLDRW